MNPIDDYFPELLKTMERLDPAAIQQTLLQAANEHSLDPRPLLLIAAQYAQAGQMDAAEASYIAALQRSPGFAIARFQLGLLQFSSGRPAAAFATWAPLNALEENHPLRLFKTGLEFLAEDKFQEAEHWLRRGTECNKENAPLNHDMQLFLTEIGRLQTQEPMRSQATPSKSDAAENVASDDKHFLVSAYRNLH